MASGSFDSMPAGVPGEVLVRPLAAGDAAPLHEAVIESMASLSQWFPWCHAGYGLPDAADWISRGRQSWDSGTGYPLGIFDGDGGLLGCTGLSHVDREAGQANLGYWVGTRHRGRGVATAAARLGFGPLGLGRIEIVVLAHNLASRRVAEKLGATRVAEAHDRLRFQGRPAPAIVYSLVPGDVAPA